MAKFPSACEGVRTVISMVISTAAENSLIWRFLVVVFSFFK